MTDFRVLVTGGRSFEDRWLLYRTLDAVQRTHGMMTIIEGGALGADRFAYEWAIEHAKTRPVEHVRFRAEWNQFGRAVGAMRNQQMLDVGKPDLVVAFPGGTGTADMVRRAKRAGVEVMMVTEGGGTVSFLDLSWEELVEKAKAFAKAKHAGQTDKSGAPYYLHPFAVADLVAAAGGTEAQIIAAYLHDTVEDTDTTLEEIEAEFGGMVQMYVDAMTRRPGESLDAYYARILKTPDCVDIKFADICHNMSPARLSKLDEATVDRLLAKYTKALGTLVKGLLSAGR